MKEAPGDDEDLDVDDCGSEDAYERGKRCMEKSVNASD